MQPTFVVGRWYRYYPPTPRCEELSWSWEMQNFWGRSDRIARCTQMKWERATFEGLLHSYIYTATQGTFRECHREQQDLF